MARLPTVAKFVVIEKEKIAQAFPLPTPAGTT
jgi:hypothetical protein